MAECNANVPPDGQILFRIGIHQGDIIVDNGDIFGDGVNVAARLEALAAPGGICISGRVQEDLQGKLNVVSEDIGEQQLKNINRPVRAYRIRPCLQEPRSTEAQREPLDRLQPSSVPVRLRNWLNSSRSRLVIIAGLRPGGSGNLGRVLASCRQFTLAIEVNYRWSTAPKDQLNCADDCIARVLTAFPDDAMAHFVKGEI